MRVAAGCASFTLAAGIVLLRLVLGGPHPFDHVWAEDGWIFLADRTARGAGALDTGYAGYGHLVPRLIAAAGAWVPLADYDLWTALTSAVVVGLLGVFCWSVAARLTGSQALGIAAAVALVLPAAWRTDSLASVAYLQWFALVALAWAAVDRPPSRWSQVTAGVVGAVAAGCSPLALLLVPTFLLTPGRRDRVGVVLGVAAGVVYQAVVVLTGPMSAGGPPRSISLRGGMAGAALRDVGGVTTAHASVLGLVVLVAVLVPVVADVRRPGVVGLVVGAVLLAAVPTVVTGTVQPRYVGAGTAVAFGALLLALAGRGVWVRVAASAVPLVVSVVAFPVAAYRLSGPRWSDELVAAAARCDGGAVSVELTVSPVGTRQVVLPCTAIPGR